MSKRGSVSKRGNGDGSWDYIEERELWRFRFAGEMGPDGKRIRTALYGKTKDEIRDKLDALKTEKATGVIKPKDLTMAQYLPYWLTRVQSELRPTTVESYQTTIRLYILPFIGAVKIGDFRRLQMTELLLKLQNTDYSKILAESHDGKKKTVYRKGVTPAKQRRVFSCISAALTKAAEWELLNANPLVGVPPPRRIKRKMTIWDTNHARTFLEQGQSDTLFPLYLLALTSGLREGEILGLQWEDVLFEQGLVVVRNTLMEVRGKILGLAPCKTDAGERSVKLPRFMVQALRDHQTRLIQSGLKDCRWVFPTRNGTNISKSNLLKAFHAMTKRIGIPKIRFHDLRHTMATLLLLRNVNVKIVSERLGHSQTAITSEIYQHILPSMQEGAVTELDAALNIQNDSLPARTTPQTVEGLVVSRDLNTKIVWPSLTEMRRLVWTMPTEEVAAQLGVSGNAVAKFCERNGIEKPGRGYWQANPSRTMQSAPSNLVVEDAGNRDATNTVAPSEIDGRRT